MKRTYLFRTLLSWLIPWPIQVRLIRNKMAAGTVIYQDDDYSIVLVKRHADAKFEATTCPDCESSNLKTVWEDFDVTYWDKYAVVHAAIPVRIPMRCCNECGLKFSDEEAEGIIQKAVDKVELNSSEE